MELRSASEALNADLSTLQHELRTGAWHGDSPLRLEFPSQWKVTTYWPKTPAPLTDQEIIHALEKPVGQPPVRELCKGKRHPVVLIDDVNRPTPAARVISPLLRQFAGAGIPAANITILVARGSHGEPQPESTLLKVGSEAASVCRVLLHDPYSNTVKIGVTSFGTLVHVNRHVAQADFVMGIGGVYPNNTAGFGGGAKLALGVLDIRAISQLHGSHKGAGWGNWRPENTFRRELEEIARMIRLESLIVGHVDADRELVRLRCGDYHLFYDEEVAFVREAFRAPGPGQADVVISNAFPNDLSLTFVHMKGVYPLHRATPAASRIAIAACSEGEGFHGVYPVIHKSRLHEQYHRLRRISRMGSGEISKKLAGKLRLRRSAPNSVPETTAPAQPARPVPKNPIWLYRTGVHDDILPSPVKGIRSLSDWNEVLAMVCQEQGGRDDLNVVVYPCAPLQVLEG